ncbi:hypothetical protein TM_0479 [Thermotoga maritima MSB8]|uniref:Protein-export membrane protein SecG n=1 Tax=Thermotoga maritima (strain ATCC 43589 / DSM 3109 / JCM 10099 / NBRC 100826 / MSB8) TaxID=243274 RepID=SECG_THEMA|nr:RecName: Full=Protein-export membrane protein SecG [Thermotoga maritima MSB8]AAD35563.1 hypothetical protein TM_0479 [Thermotoga maritima MSB8]
MKTFFLIVHTIISVALIYMVQVQMSKFSELGGASEVEDFTPFLEEEKASTPVERSLLSCLYSFSFPA